MTKHQKRQAYLKEIFGINPLNDKRLRQSKERLLAIRIYYEEMESGAHEQEIDEITWNDLEMDDVFVRLNQTKSYIGEQVLYRRLHCWEKDADWTAFEQQQAFYLKNESERLRIEEALMAIGKREEAYYLPRFLKHAEICTIGVTAVYHILQLLLLAFVALAVATRGALALPAVLLAFVNLGIYVVTKNKYEVFLDALMNLKQMIDFDRLMEQLPQWKGQSPLGTDLGLKQDLARLRWMIGSMQSRRYSAASGDPFAVFLDYLYGVTLYDLSLFNHITKLIDKRTTEIMALYDFAGSVDFGIAIASFRASLPTCCQPVLWDQPALEAQGLFHPLVEEPVGNDFVLRRNALITGANASGKSTFLKALAINVLLGQAVHTCAAASMQMQRCMVMTSMAVRDSTLTKESYYMREVSYLKRMLDTVEAQIPVLCVIDEILKGTNTGERLAASEAVLHYFSKKHGLAAVATHDMELVERLRERYDCYYFQSTMEDGDISFDYCIHKGIGGESNAISMLAQMGFPEEILTYSRRCMQRAKCCGAAPFDPSAGTMDQEWIHEK